MVPQRIPPVTADSDKIPSVTVVVLLAGALARLWVATRGHNFDFESWLIAADIFSHGGNIYAETSRYIYGPVWFLLLGMLWPIARIFPDSALAFRYILPCLLTFVDIGIFVVLRKKFGQIAAILFFLNPISIIISGYHIQFDNIAILLGLIAIGLWGEQSGATLDKRKFASLATLGLSIATKHVLFAFPLWLAVKQKGVAQKIVVLALPISLFFLSFLPFWQAGHQGIIRQVFLYPSMNNGIFWNYLPGFIRLVVGKDIIFFFLLALFSFVFRNRSPLDSLLLYTCILLIFSPSINNQYLAVPVAFISVYPNILFLLYTLTAAFYIFADNIGLGWLLSSIPQNLIGYPAHITLLSIGFIFSLSSQWVRSELRRGWAGWRSLAAVVATVVAAVFLFRIIDAETARRRFTASPPPTMIPTQADFGGKVRLLGYNAYDSDFRPGGKLSLTLYWQALQPPDTDYTASIQLLDPANQRLSGADVPLGFDYILPYPSSRWRTGETIRQTYSLALPQTDTATPLRVVAIVYDTPDNRLPITASNVEILGDAVAITGVSTLLEPLPSLSAPHRPLNILTGAQIDITGTSLDATYTLDPTSSGVNHSLTFEVDWYARAHPDRLYHVFLHLFDAKRNLIAQFDGPPISAFPTDAWPPESTWRGTYTLILPQDLPPGDYALVAGVYQVGTGERLSLSGDAPLLLPDNRFLLSTIHVEP